MWEADAGVSVTEIKAIRRAGETIGPENQWTTVQGACNRQESTSGKTVYEYDSSAMYPVDQVRLQFSEKNTLVTAGIFSRSDNTEPWRYRQGGSLYNLGEDAMSLVQDTVSIEPVSDRYWRVEIVGGMSGDAGAVLEMGWIPHDLLFVAQGDGPYMLAYGSARLGNEALPGGMPELLTAMAKKDAEQLLKTATPGAEVELGGVGQRIPAPPPLPWKKWVLWGVLVIGVGIIAWMAVSLGRGMGNGGSPH
jgi:hypothetical protein